MTCFKVLAPKSVEKQLFALPESVIERILAKIEALTADVFHAGGKDSKEAQTGV